MASRAGFVLACMWMNIALAVTALEPIPDKTVVLTFDDAVKSQREFVAPTLKELGFGATFFVTALWMNDTEHFMTWQEIAELHRMGFEIGNHSWNHGDYGTPRGAAHLAGELTLIDGELKKVEVPTPQSFAWCGNSFGPEGMAVLKEHGILFARRGMQPEIPYGQAKPGPLYDPAAYNPLLIPSAGDAYPNWTLDNFKRAVERAKDGKIAVVQFHGVPDIAHPWVNTPPERFTEYMRYLKDNGFHVIAMRDLAQYVDPAADVADAMTMVHYTSGLLDPPVESEATRANAAFWLSNMLARHHYTHADAAKVFALPVKTFEARYPEFMKNDAAPSSTSNVLPYPGGRHPRIGFLEGAVDPLRGTKASVFSPWDDGGYAVVDLPEAIFSDLGLTFLAHTHIPTIWDDQHVAIENRDWEVRPDGSLENTWTLPNGIKFGGTVTPVAGGADLELWLENGTKESLKGLRTQVCVMLKGLPGFDAQTNDNKQFETAEATAKSADGRAVTIEFDHAGRVWGNPKCPCMHVDPVLDDCGPGARVSAAGHLRFLGGK